MVMVVFFTSKHDQRVSSPHFGVATASSRSPSLSASPLVKAATQKNDESEDPHLNIFWVMMDDNGQSMMDHNG